MVPSASVPDGDSSGCADLASSLGPQGVESEFWSLSSFFMFLYLLIHFLKIISFLIKE